MKLEREIEVINRLGLHARACASLVKAAVQFSSTIALKHDGQSCDAKSIMGLMMLAATQGTRLTLVVEGEDSQQAVRRIVELRSIAVHHLHLSVPVLADIDDHSWLERGVAHVVSECRCPVLDIVLGS